MFSNYSTDLPGKNTTSTYTTNSSGVRLGPNSTGGFAAAYSDKILDLESYNGRVNIIEPPAKHLLFQMAEKIDLKNKPTDYRDALTGTWEHNMLEQIFFSAENIQIIQNAMKAAVYQMSNNRYILPNQNIQQLKVVMRGMYLQYAEHYADNIKGQVERLNKIVLDYTIPSVYNEAVSYEKYCRDASTLVTPMARPLQHNRDYKQLELKPWT